MSGPVVCPGLVNPVQVPGAVCGVTEQEVAFADVHVSVAEFPEVMLTGPPEPLAFISATAGEPQLSALPVLVGVSVESVVNRILSIRILDSRP